MQYIAAYSLLVLGGNAQPTFQDIKNLFSEIQYDGSDYFIKMIIFALKGKNIDQIKSNYQNILEQFALDGQQFIDQQNTLKILFDEEQRKEEEEKIRLEQIAQQKKKEEERLKLIELEKQKREEEEKLRLKQLEDQRRREEEEKLRIKQLEEQKMREIELEKQRKEQEEKLRKQRLEEERRLAEEQRRREQQIFQQRQEELKLLETQKKLAEQLKVQNPKEKLSRLDQEIQTVSQNNAYSKTFQTYQVAKCEQEQLRILKENNQARQVTSISHISQKIVVENQDVLFYVLTENLRRDQDRELLLTQKSQIIGLTSVLFSQSEDQKCYKYHTTKYDFDEINNDQIKKAVFIQDFMSKISESLKVPITDIEILDIKKGSVHVNFVIKSKDSLNDDELRILNTVCGGVIEVFWYFAGPQQAGQNNYVGLSSEDFSPKFNMQWENFQEKEQRGPRYHRYDYYFPKGYYGYALNVLNNERRQYGKDNSWIQMDGNDNEWRILYHGTKHANMCSIVRNGLAPRSTQNTWQNDRSFQNDDCYYQGKLEKIGKGVYFSDRIGQCAEFAPPTQVGDKYFALVFQSRVNPRAIKQSDAMKNLNYFLVNRSQDIRPYRILLKDVGRQYFLDWNQRYNV